VAKSTTRSKSRRRIAGPSRKRRASRRAASAPRVIRLKPLYNQIGRVLKQLEQLQKRKAATAGVEFQALAEAAPAADPVSRAIARLTQHQRDFDEMCGPTMAIPAP